MIEVDDDAGYTTAEEDSLDPHEGGQTVPRVSVNAVHGLSDYTTMRVKGVHNKKFIFILIDSGSTHNFMDVKIAAQLGCVVQKSGLSQVAVADGGRIGVHGKVDQFTWTFQTTTFTDDFMLIPLGGCDMVLGVQWLQSLGPISWDFKTLEMGFVYKKKKVLLHGIKAGSVREVKAVKLNKKRESQAQISMIYVQNVDAEQNNDMMVCSLEATKEKEEHPAVRPLLEKFQDIFEEPTSLPPFRDNHNHKIPLLEGSDPVNQRPYRYALYQKNEIDNIVKEMLTNGTIQPSSSPYASPVVLVKKRMGLGGFVWTIGV